MVGQSVTPRLTSPKTKAGQSLRTARLLYCFLSLINSILIHRLCISTQTSLVPEKLHTWSALLFVAPAF